MIKIKNEDENKWQVEVTEIKIKQDEYEARIVRLIKVLIEIDQSLFPQDSHADSDNVQITKEAA